MHGKRNLCGGHNGIILYYFRRSRDSSKLISSTSGYKEHGTYQIFQNCVTEEIILFGSVYYRPHKIKIYGTTKLCFRWLFQKQTDLFSFSLIKVPLKISLAIFIFYNFSFFCTEWNILMFDIHDKLFLSYDWKFLRLGLEILLVIFQSDLLCNFYRIF